MVFALLGEMRKVYLLIIVVCVLSIHTLEMRAQTMSVSKRTPEQEATVQTEKLQKELNLNSNQIKKIYEINLKYANKRKFVKNRTESMDLIIKKNEDICEVLDENQRFELQNRRQNGDFNEKERERRFSNSDSNSVNSTSSEKRTSKSTFQNNNKRVQQNINPFPAENRQQQAARSNNKNNTTPSLNNKTLRSVQSK